MQRKSVQLFPSVVHPGTVGCNPTQEPFSNPNSVFDSRVDGKDVVNVPQRRLSFDCKTSKFSQQSDIISHAGSTDHTEKVGVRSKVVSDRSLG